MTLWKNHEVMILLLLNWKDWGNLGEKIIRGFSSVTAQLRNSVQSISASDKKTVAKSLHSDKKQRFSVKALHDSLHYLKGNMWEIIKCGMTKTSSVGVSVLFVHRHSKSKWKRHHCLNVKCNRCRRKNNLANFTSALKLSLSLRWQEMAERGERLSMWCQGKEAGFHLGMRENWMVSYWEHICYSHTEDKQTVLKQIRMLPKGSKREVRVHEREKSK